MRIAQFLLALAVVARAATALAQYSIGWYSISGGGGSSAGGPFTLSGTIGQPDTATMSGGVFTLEGGFWSVVTTVPAPGVPALSVSWRGGVLKVAWPLTAVGWVLESTPALSGPSLAWTQVTQPYQNDGTSFYITLVAPSGNTFFRLRGP
jgi:hypothetical protein